ncbi:MAG: phospholipase D-like domain-containing protein [Candidatus Micrarchaeota archaeon]
MHKQLLLLAVFVLGVLFGFLAFSSMHVEEKSGCINGEIEYIFSPDAEDDIIGVIRSAGETIDLEMYLFNYEPLADELIRARERGVRVRVILEPRLFGDNPNLEMMEYLRAGGLEVRWASLEYKLTHTKAMIVDGKRVLVGSTNWSYSALKKNREYSVLIDDGGVAREFTENFELDWGKAEV